MERPDGISAPMALKRLREKAGLSMEELAHAAGYKHASGIQRYESDTYIRKHFPVDLVRRLAPALAGRGNPPITVREIYLTLAGVLPPAMPPDQIQPNVRRAPATTPLAFGDMPRDVPVYGVGAAGKSGDFSLNGEIVDRVRRPPGIADRQGVFAIYVEGASMSPWREPGDLVYLDSNRAPRPGDYVVVECHGQHGEPGPAYLKRLVAVNADTVRLLQYNPPDDRIEISQAAVKRIFRVIDWPELLGA